jgi:hypothetical protein
MTDSECFVQARPSPGTVPLSARFRCGPPPIKNHTSDDHLSGGGRPKDLCRGSLRVDRWQTPPCIW